MGIKLRKVHFLSKSPQKAIVIIKTYKNTPYATYTKALDKIMAAYDGLRNQASLEEFGKAFGSFKEGSKERSQIKNMYPKKISIKQPSNS